MKRFKDAQDHSKGSNVRHKERQRDLMGESGEAAAPPAQQVITRSKFVTDPRTGESVLHARSADSGVEAAAPVKPPIIPRHVTETALNFEDEIAYLQERGVCAPPAPQAAATDKVASSGEVSIALDNLRNKLICDACGMEKELKEKDWVHTHSQVVECDAQAAARPNTDDSDTPRLCPSCLSPSHDGKCRPAQAAAEAAPTQDIPKGQSAAGLASYVSLAIKTLKNCKAAHPAEAEPPSAREFDKSSGFLTGSPSILTAGKTFDPLADWQKAVAYRFAEAFASSLRDTNAALREELERIEITMTKPMGKILDELRAILQTPEEHSITEHATKIVTEHTALRAERDALKEWKESAMVQLGKHDKLRQVLPSRYLGWDVIDAAMDYIEKHEAQPA